MSELPPSDQSDCRKLTSHVVMYSNRTLKPIQTELSSRRATEIGGMI